MEENKKTTPDPEQDMNSEKKVNNDGKKESDIQPPKSVEPTVEAKTKKPAYKLAILGVIAMVAIAVVVLYGCLSGTFFNTHIHKYGEWSTTKNATCEEEGVITRYCDCGENQNETIPADGHNFGDWNVVTAATCVSEGEEGRTCVKCADYESRAIAKSDVHTPVKDEGINPTCSSEGLSEGAHCVVCDKILEAQVSLPKAEHKLSNIQMEDEYCGEAQVSSIYCGDCGEYVTSFGHHYIKSVTEATCTEDGEVRYICDICGNSYFNVISAGGHIGGVYEIVTPATCKNEGVAEQKCMVCDELIDTLTLDKKSHSYSIISHDGSTITYGCGECGQSYSLESELEVFTVNFKSDNQIVATVSVAYGGKIENLPEIEKDGYRLAHWLINDGSEAIYDSGCIYEDTELVAVWEEETVINTKESDIAVFSGVGVDFAFTVIADDMSYVTDNLSIYNIDDEQIPYQVVCVGTGIYAVTSEYYQPGKFYYAVVKNDVAFAGTESKEIHFSILGENYVNIEIGSSVQWLEYSDVYGIIDTDKGKVLLTSCIFNKGDSVAIYEDSKENLVLVIDILNVDNLMGYNAYLFDVADYEEVFDNFEVDISGNLSDGEFAIDPMAAEAIKTEFMASPLYRSARSAAVMWGEKYGLNLGGEKYDFSASVKDGRIIISIKYTIEFEENWEISIIHKSVVSVDFSYHTSLNKGVSAIVETTNRQTIEITLANSVTTTAKHENAAEAYTEKLKEYKEILEKIKNDKTNVKDLDYYFEKPKDIALGTQTFLIGGTPVAITINPFIEFNFEETGAVGVAFEITNTISCGVRNGKVVNSKSIELTGVNAYVSGKIRVEFLLKLEVFINVAGVGLYGNIGAGPYAEIGGAGSMGYDGHDLYMAKYSVYLDAGVRVEVNVGVKAELHNITLFDLNYEIYGKDYSFSGLPLGSKEIWLSFEDYEEEVNISGACDDKNNVILNEIINTAIKYQDLDDMTFGYKNPDKVYYSIDSVSGYRSKIRLDGTSLAFDSIGEDVEVVLKIKVSDTIYKTVVINYTVNHADDCIHFLCSIGQHSGGKATCTDKAICERCGLEYGDEPIGYHTYEDRECIRCGEYLASEGLKFALLDNGTYEVKGIGSCKDTLVVIPTTYDGQPVTSIGKNAFRGCNLLTSIVIPDSVTSIGDDPFYRCTSLTDVYITDIAAWCGISFSANNSNPLYSAKNLYLNGELVTDLVIPNGVTSIGNYVFYDCDSLTSIVIPDSVTSIGNSAFADCSSLNSIKIPDGVTKIGSYAFAGCTSLTSIAIPDSVTSIGDSAFHNCDSLKGVYITDIAAWCGISFSANDSNPLCYAEKLYLNGELVTNLVIPDGVTSIGSYVFDDCKSLVSVTIGNGVTNIGNSAFADCSSLNSIKIPDGVTKIGSYAFAGCTSLTSIAIPDSVTSIGYKAFYYCTWLMGVKMGNGVTSIGGEAFKLCTSLTSIVIPDSVTSIGNSAFNDCESLKFNEYSNGYYLGNDSNPYHVFIKAKDSSITSCNIHPSTKIIAYYAFDDCDSLTSIVIPDSVTSIGYSAFARCSSLTSIAIPDSVTKIDPYAFYNCIWLTSVTIGNGVTEIHISAFDDCTSLKGVYITDVAAWCGISFGDYDSNPLYYANNLYLNGELVTNLVIPDGVTEIGSYAFDGCTSLTSIVIPDSVTEIGSYAFDGCTSLTSIVIPDSVTEIGYYAFRYCTSLTSVTIGNGVTSIGYKAFCNCSSLTSITIPDSVTSIDQSAFYNCNSLTSVTFKDVTGWYVTKSYGAPSGTNLTLTDASQNARYLNRTYDDYYWYKR